MDLRSCPKARLLGRHANANHATSLPNSAELVSAARTQGAYDQHHSRRFHAQHYTVNMTFRVVLEHDPETGDYSAVCPELPGCASAGETEAEARANIREAIELYLTPGNIDLPEDAKLFEVTVG